MLLRLIVRPRLVDDDDTVDRVARIRLGGDEGKRLVAAGGQRLVAVAAVGRRLRVRDRRDRFVWRCVEETEETEEAVTETIG